MKNNKGITLIALVVTIIVLLILAGVAIAMLRGDNGILNRASEAKYDNVIGSVNEQVKLSHMSLRTAITSNMVGQEGYIATNATNFQKLVDSVVSELNAKTKTEAAKGEDKTTGATSQEGYIVYQYLNHGDDKTDGEGFILITYSDNALRSSLTKDVEGALTNNKISLNSVTFTRAGGAQPYSVNQAVLAYVIRVTNYNCTLSNAVLTDSTARIEAAGIATGADGQAVKFCKTTLNANGTISVDSTTSTLPVIGRALAF